MNLKTAINLESASTLWHFYCSSINVFVMWLSGYVLNYYIDQIVILCV